MEEKKQSVIHWHQEKRWRAIKCALEYALTSYESITLPSQVWGVMDSLRAVSEKDDWGRLVPKHSLGNITACLNLSIRLSDSEEDVRAVLRSISWVHN